MANEIQTEAQTQKAEGETKLDKISRKYRKKR